MNSTYKIMICDVESIFSIGLRVLLATQPDFEVISSSDHTNDIYETLANMAPDLLITDLGINDIESADDIASIKEMHPKTKILLVTQYNNEDTVRSTLCAGASGYVLKDASNSELITAVRCVLDGKVYLSPSLSDHIINVFLLPEKEFKTKPYIEKLTNRELEILKMVVHGHTNRSVAEQLRLSIKTVEKHRSNLMKKLDIHNITGLTDFAVGHGLVAAKD